jgi:hypothetical protein
MVGTELANANEELEALGAAAAGQAACVEAMQRSMLTTGLGVAAVVTSLRVFSPENARMTSCATAKKSAPA